MRLLSLASAALALTLATAGVASAATDDNKRCFPDDFMFGSATASYQVEGAWNESGRTPSIWDDFCRASPGMECANVADDFFHRYKQDIDLMVETGLSSFRFSVSWSRAMNWDASTQRMKPNAPGIAFYHDLIDALHARGVTPILTLYHWDLPSELHTQLSPSGWLNREIVGHFVEYAELMYKEFGAKIDFWTTFNEPTSFIIHGYGTGDHAPGLPQSPTNTYDAAHNMLIAHARAVQRFRELKKEQKIGSKAKIGIVLVTDYSYPLNPANPADVAAAERKMEFMFGWFLRPIVYGEYPQVMRERVGDRLPKFTTEEANLLKGSYDLFMLNHYHSMAVTDCDSPEAKKKCSEFTLGWERDHGCDDSQRPVGARRSSTGPNGEFLCPWFSAYPQGYLDTIKWMHKHDTSASILLTENGWCGNATIDNQDQMWYYQNFLKQVHIAVTEEKIPVIGYTAWSFLDNYEWGSFKPRFGLYYVNFTSQTGSNEGWTPKSTDLARIPRPTAKWYSKLAKTKCMELDPALIEAPTTHEKSQLLSGSSDRSGMSAVTTSLLVIVPVALIVAGAAVIVRRRRQSSANERTPLL